MRNVIVQRRRKMLRMLAWFGIRHSATAVVRVGPTLLPIPFYRRASYYALLKHTHAHWIKRFIKMFASGNASLRCTLAPALSRLSYSFSIAIIRCSLINHKEMHYCRYFPVYLHTLRFKSPHSNHAYLFSPTSPRVEVLLNSTLASKPRAPPFTCCMDSFSLPLAAFKSFHCPHSVAILPFRLGNRSVLKFAALALSP